MLNEYQRLNLPPSPGACQIYQAVLRFTMGPRLKLMILLPHPLECQDTNYSVRRVPTHELLMSTL